MVRKISGKGVPGPVTHLTTPDGDISSSKDIADTLASTFEKKSSSSNLSEGFLRNKTT